MHLQMEQSGCRYWASSGIRESEAPAKGSRRHAGTQEHGTGTESDGLGEGIFFFLSGLDLASTGLAYSP
jgi:hypothetical protein